ncbi:GH24480 [Drosophila grimshawi]|uniref:GH24480 n=1 Tax=Drosophila grimshawi TaxID=7222 RepID=B4JLN4_DROGR|nr:GH24480 [Drosophila grimshawi]
MRLSLLVPLRSCCYVTDSRKTGENTPDSQDAQDSTDNGDVATECKWLVDVERDRMRNTATHGAATG